MQNIITITDRVVFLGVDELETLDAPWTGDGVFADGVTAATAAHDGVVGWQQVHSSDLATKTEGAQNLAKASQGFWQVGHDMFNAATGN
uniref:Uncharacterized protein n=1 Tax=Streptomyces sp. NBC_00003 TaxID=2903608 RepID=A0AAU2UVM3_9ACTN